MNFSLKAGSNPWGFPSCGYQDSINILNRFVEAGGSFIDTYALDQSPPSFPDLQFRHSHLIKYHLSHEFNRLAELILTALVNLNRLVRFLIACGRAVFVFFPLISSI
jgi:hypothetical protein